jgi:DNA-binding MarR family transcriptional regulator
LSPNVFPEEKADHGRQLELEDSVARVIAGWGRSRPDLDVAPIAVTARVPRLANELQPRVDAVLGRHGVRGADFGVIATLVRLDQGAVSQATLGRELNLSPGTISVRVDRLEREGFVAREPDPDDQRRTAVALTDRGRELFEACAAEHLQNSRDLLSGLDEGEREQLGALLGKLLASLEDPGPDELLLALGGLVVSSPAESLRLRGEVGLPPLPGVLVRHVEPEGPAARAGVRRGDLIRTVDGRRVRGAADLRAAFASTRGGSCGLELVRGAEPVAADVRPRRPRGARKRTAAKAAGRSEECE